MKDPFSVIYNVQESSLHNYDQLPNVKARKEEIEEIERENTCRYQITSNQMSDEEYKDEIKINIKHSEQED